MSVMKKKGKKKKESKCSMHYDNFFCLALIAFSFSTKFLEEIPHVPVPFEKVVRMHMTGRGCDCEYIPLMRWSNN